MPKACIKNLDFFSLLIKKIKKSLNTNIFIYIKTQKILFQLISKL